MNKSKKHTSGMKSIFVCYRYYAVFSLCLLFIAASITLTACDIFSNDNDENSASDDGIIRSVVKAPVAPDGNVAGRITDLVLNLNVSLDPKKPGFTLRTGDQIKVSMPEAFEKGQNLPLLTIFDCIPQLPQCDAVVPLLGWPQGALGTPPSLGYELSFENSHTIVIMATEDLIPNPPLNPGLKQIHLLLNSFTNPAPGEYQIEVEVMTEAGITHGIGQARILAETQPSIEVTNAFHNFMNANFQETSLDSLTPFPFDFYLWNSEGSPWEGVTIEGNQLVKNDEVVGLVSIEAPSGATGQEVFTEESSTNVPAAVTGIPAGHLRVFFRAGSETGEYVVTLELDSGNAVEMIVRVQ